MPKYFSDERPLLFKSTIFRPSELTVAALSALFTKRKDNTISLCFDGFEEGCLGFLVHVRKANNRFELLNIAEEVELFVGTEEQLREVIRHVSGVDYSERVQQVFQQIRNDIGSGVPLNACSTTS